MALSRRLSAIFRAGVTILQGYSLYPAFEAVSRSSFAEGDEVEYLAKSITTRSNIIFGCLLAIIAFIGSAHDALNNTYSPGSQALPLAVLVLYTMTKAFIEGAPLRLFRTRIRRLTPFIVSILYASAEIYIGCFALNEIYHRCGQRVFALFMGFVVGHILLVVVRTS
ncbi:hypothetical protein DL96DRAFT_571989 [Flagelloscypha sp. PMI_526]|nr:hypothetical protein DL96DRAFT_571989 [Flagelloscypha sp. PMI_526]